MLRMNLSTRSVCFALAVAALAPRPVAQACGGFFCQQVPIDQIGEQIIFRQDGGTTTAIVLIQYQGAAEDFSWVVPVPGVPEFSVGSSLLFQQLEPLTRPQFGLDVEGERCFDPNGVVFDAGGAPAPEDNAADGDDGVTVLEQVAVGPFDVVVVTSDDPDALTQWLNDNNYDVSERGRQLIAPYVADGFNFVAVRLQQDREVGDIEPLRMVYQSSRPMIPIALTAVAAQPDMGVATWILAEARAIPTNYLHVIPNYSKLDWYAGGANAYASYQDLITEAMDEVGGQGFATDYAGRDAELLAPLGDLPGALRDEAERLAAIERPEFALAELVSFSPFPGAKVLELYRRHLPLDPNTPAFRYGDSSALAERFDAQTLRDALTRTLAELELTITQPLEDTLRVFDGNPYLTRLYTTLSPEEMTLDPEFGFNDQLGDQGLARRATLAVDCVAGQTQWSLTLGAGTGRDGELVIEATGQPPFFGVPAALADQPAVKLAESLREASADGDIIVDNDFEPVLRPETPGANNGGGSTDNGGGDSTDNGDSGSDGVQLPCALGAAPVLMLMIGAWSSLRRARRAVDTRTSRSASGGHP